MKLASENEDQMQVFVIINNVGRKKNVDLNLKNRWTKEYVIKDLFGIPVVVNVDFDVGEYLGYKILNVERGQLIYQSKNASIDENEMTSVTLNNYENICNSCAVYIIFFVIAFLIISGIISVFIYFHWYLKKSNTGVGNINPGTETVIYSTYKLEISNKLRSKIVHITFLMT